MSTSVSSVVSHFPSAENGFTTTTSGSVSSGATTVGLNSVAGYSNGEIAVFVIDPTLASKQTFTGVIDTAGVQVTNVVWTAGSNTTHASGATVVDYATATHISMMTKGILVEHNQDGTHSDITGTTLSLTGDIDLADTKGIRDGNNNEVIKISQTASAVNELTVKNAATGNQVQLQATGGDTNIGLKGVPKGSGVNTGFMAVKIGSFTATAATGNQSVTGVGFTPKLVLFQVLFDTGSNQYESSGGMESNGNQWAACSVNSAESRSATSAAIYVRLTGPTTSLVAAYVSMDSDGFTINKTTAGAAYTVAYTAIG